jgi:hypothetical protein
MATQTNTTRRALVSSLAALPAGKRKGGSAAL